VVWSLQLGRICATPPTGRAIQSGPRNQWIGRWQVPDCEPFPPADWYTLLTRLISLSPDNVFRATSQGRYFHGRPFATGWVILSLTYHRDRRRLPSSPG
jgi:hypothetical protein